MYTFLQISQHNTGQWSKAKVLVLCSSLKGCESWPNLLHLQKNPVEIKEVVEKHRGKPQLLITLDDLCELHFLALEKKQAEVWFGQEAIHANLFLGPLKKGSATKQHAISSLD